MVFKVSKGGVRSGNTLRGLRCLRTRRYSRQACIVSHSSLSPQEVNNFLETSTEDDFITNTLGATDVILSLNKKKRWILPATVSHMIKAGSFNNSKIYVSLLERHKLKRKANCVSFICNQGRIRHVTPRQKRYFSFNLDTSSSDTSNRAIRRHKAVLAVKVPAIKLTRNRQSGVMKTVDVFTVTGSEISDSVVPKEVVPKLEYRLEVFFPCPTSCSLVYNPKYTNVHTENGKDGDTQIKSNIKSTRAKKKHRNRFSLKDLKKLEDDMAKNCIDDFSEDDYEIVEASRESSNHTESEAGVDRSETDLEENRMHSSRHILEYLIAEAEKANLLCGNDQHHRRSPSPGCCNVDSRVSESEDKSHIFYVNEQKPQSKPLPVSQQTHNYKVLHSARVILPETDSNSENLRAKYGYLYAESESEPRRFLINVTKDVQNLLSTSCCTEEDLSFISYLVFIYDGFYDENLDAFQVIFNSNICTETLEICKNIPFEETSVEEIMNRVVSVLLDMKQDNQISVINSNSFDYMLKPKLNIIHNALNINVETFHAQDEIRRVSHTDTLQENMCKPGSIRNVVTNLDSSLFCGICYDNINPTQVEAASGTMLHRCGHRFCDECWRSHCRTRFKDGGVKMVCPGYSCDVIVGPVTLLSLLHVSEIIQLFQRMCEDEVEASPNSKWCPNLDCGRVIRIESEKLTNDLSLDVTCACGQEFCFSCLSQPHWPATCYQAEVYAEKLLTIKLPNETPEEKQSPATAVNSLSAKRGKVKAFEVEGRLCPKCMRFIEKNGGCNFISCKCGHYFCWACLKQSNNHYECKPNPAFVFEYTRRVMIKHIVTPSVKTPVNSTKQPSIDSKKPPKRYHKVTMCQKALQQRFESKEETYCKQLQEFAKRITSVAQRDHQLKRDLLSLLNVQCDLADDDSVVSTSVVLPVRKFLRSCHEIKLALHRVAEFTFVLLQDEPDSVDKRKVLRLANDLSGYCSFMKSILELGPNQDIRTAVKRLADIQIWARRALVAHIYSVNKFRS